VADSKLIIGAAVTMTTLEIYLEKLCKIWGTLNDTV
jgi:hypothetical protein